MFEKAIVVNPNLPRWRRLRARLLGARDPSLTLMAGCVSLLLSLAPAGVLAEYVSEEAGAISMTASLTVHAGFAAATAVARLRRRDEVAFADDINDPTGRQLLALRVHVDAIVDVVGRDRGTLDLDPRALLELLNQVLWEASLHGRRLDRLGGRPKEPDPYREVEEEPLSEWQQRRRDLAAACAERLDHLRDLVEELGLVIEEVALESEGLARAAAGQSDLILHTGTSAPATVATLIESLRARAAAYRQLGP